MYSAWHWIDLIILILTVVFAAVFTIRRGTKTDTGSLLLKVIASFFFILLGLAGSMTGTPQPYGLFLIAGLICGLIGDIYLDMKYVYPQDGARHTFTGFGAFMAGHIFYLLFLLQACPVRAAHLLISVAAGVLAGIVIFTTPKLMRLDYGKFRLISSAYAGLLVLITVYALLLETAGGHSISKLLFLIGIVLFLISDLILSQIYFGKNKNTTGNKLLNHAAYYAGQILIAVSIYFSGSFSGG